MQTISSIISPIKSLCKKYLLLNEVSTKRDFGQSCKTSVGKQFKCILEFHSGSFIEVIANFNLNITELRQDQRNAETSFPLYT
jgi:hypothetical protein